MKSCHNDHVYSYPNGLRFEVKDIPDSRNTKKNLEFFVHNNDIEGLKNYIKTCFPCSIKTLAYPFAYNLLVTASVKGYSKMLDVIMSNWRIDLSKISSYDENVLILASRANQAEVVKKLLSYGMNGLYKNKHGVDSLISAAQNGSNEVLEILAQKYPNNLWGPLMIACSKENIELIRIILKYTDDINIINHTNRKGHSPFMITAIKGNEEILELLLDHQTDVSNVTRAMSIDSIEPEITDLLNMKMN